MAGLGKKLSRKTKKLGHKIDKKAHQLGHKSHDVLSKVQGANDKIINTSEKILHKARKGVDGLDHVLNAVVEAGGADIPVLGSGIKLAADATHGARQGLDKGDKAVHKYKNASNKVSKHAEKHVADLEKFNIRKKLAQAARDDPDDGFA